jgi:hypothetical protein
MGGRVTARPRMRIPGSRRFPHSASPSPGRGFRFSRLDRPSVALTMSYDRPGYLRESLHDAAGVPGRSFPTPGLARLPTLLTAVNSWRRGRCISRAGGLGEFGMRWVRLTRDRWESRDGMLQVRRVLLLHVWDGWVKSESGRWARLPFAPLVTRKGAQRKAARAARLKRRSPLAIVYGPGEGEPGSPPPAVKCVPAAALESPGA